MDTHASIGAGTKPSLINYVAAIFAATGSFLFGYDSGIIGSVISPGYHHFHEYFNEPNDAVIGAIVSVFAGGAFFGALVAGQTADRIGRKRTIQLGSVVGIVGCTVQTASVNAAMLIAGRAVAGLSIGILSMIVPMYQAEISPPHARGLLSGWTQMMISWGFFAANWIGYGCQFIDGTGQFRVPLAIQIVPAVVLLVGMFFLPYSPRWLVGQGRTEEAKTTLIRLHGGRKTASLDAVNAEYDEMCVQIEWEREHVSSSYKDLVSTRPNLHRTVCGCLVQAMCQFTGVNVNNYFGPAIYTALGFGGTTTLMINGISGAWGVICVFTFITFIVDRIGRRKPLIFGSIALALCMAWQAGTNAPFSKDPDYQSRSVGIAGIAAVFVFNWMFSWSFGPVSWIYQSEIFPMNIRALGASVSTASNWLNNVIIAQATPPGFKHLGFKYFLVFMATNVSNAVICYFLFPETKGKTLEEIGLLFGDSTVRSIVARDSTTLQRGLEKEEIVAVEHPV